jgi:hypothetical protein
MFSRLCVLFSFVSITTFGKGPPQKIGGLTIHNKCMHVCMYIYIHPPQRPIIPTPPSPPTPAHTLMLTCGVGERERRDRGELWESGEHGEHGEHGGFGVLSGVCVCVCMACGVLDGCGGV